MAKLIKMVCEAHPDNSQAEAWWAYFDSKPTKKDCIDAWKMKYPYDSSVSDSDIQFMPDSGPDDNMIDPLIHLPGIWRVYLGCYC